jgi:glycosyltransferase involved in cell wall biosynthesis
MIPTMLTILNLFYGTRYLLILNGVLWETWQQAGRSRTRVIVYDKLFRLACQRSRAVICNSHYLRRRLCREFPELSGKVHTIYNGIDCCQPSALQPFPYEDDVTHFLTITNFEYLHKYVGVLLVLAALNHEQMAGAKLHVLGKVLSRRGERRAAELSGIAQAQFPNVSVNLYLNAPASSFFQPNKATFVYSSGEGGDSLPRALLEAQGSGMPSVVVDTNGCAEAVISGRSALVVRPNEKALRQAMCAITDSSFDRITMSKLAVENVRSRFSWGKMAAAYAPLLVDEL